MIPFKKRKRIFDILFSSAVLLLGLPFLITIAFLIKISSKGPIFYCSLRLGHKGRLFKFWKFRSMCYDADSRLQHLLKQQPKLNREWQKFFKLKNDPRLTYLGRLIRKTSLDELPQFWNVLKGDLSIVGPRPYLPYEEKRIKELIGSNIDILFSIKPGLTGIWQTSGRSVLNFEERVALDLSYVQTHSFLLDMQLIAKTIPEMIASKGAF
ncbi:MAG: sugar transferase [Chlamydiales bacterium]|nr:sugar transferase [Chlamydiales bacterium]